MEHPSELSPDGQVGTDKGREGCAGDEASVCRRPRSRKVPGALEELDSGQHITNTGRGTPEVAEDGGGQAQPSPLLQARRSLPGMLTRGKAWPDVCLCQRQRPAGDNVDGGWVFTHYPIASCLSTCKKHFSPSFLYRCALRG